MNTTSCLLVLLHYGADGGDNDDGDGGERLQDFDGGAGCSLCSWQSSGVAMRGRGAPLRVFVALSQSLLCPNLITMFHNHAQNVQARLGLSGGPHTPVNMVDAIVWKK